jgi:pimeloyl-ACP methyl ester carboxylesterase
MTSALAYDDVGTGPAVVFLHGHPFDRSMWHHQRDALAAEGFRVIAPDLRGYGASPVTPGTVTMRALADDVEALLDDLGIAQAAAVGMSMGGLVAMELGIANPARWTALGLLVTTADPPGEEDARTRREMADATEREGIEFLVEAMTPKLFGPGAPPELVDEVVAVMRRTDPRGAAAALRGRAERPDYRPGLRALRAPTLVVAGSEDAYSTPEVIDRLVAALPDPQVVRLDGIGHMPQQEAPEALTAALLAFLRR